MNFFQSWKNWEYFSKKVMTKKIFGKYFGITFWEFFLGFFDKNTPFLSKKIADFCYMFKKISKLTTIAENNGLLGFRNLLRAQNFCYEVSLKVTDFVTNYEFWEHCWAPPKIPGVFLTINSQKIAHTAFLLVFCTFYRFGLKVTKKYKQNEEKRQKFFQWNY